MIWKGENETTSLHVLLKLVPMGSVCQAIDGEANARPSIPLTTTSLLRVHDGTRKVR